ncbi:MAG TPA: pitrilysin family protein [Methylibium sp.]|uniref:M16 family metallopeptidase n=1 Tax=Methylibium sp. TaxID=2067992 RepID=UPI002DB6A3EE|nr:pitrilysin family protein [Methylibium sp.]HEU4460332.1 pitrilysin family protein [Methylibium sp.]
MTVPKLFVAALCAGVLGAACAAPVASPPAALPKNVSAVTAVEGILEYRLANGLRVLLVRDDSKPTTTVNLTYHVGSRHENYGETGMAHLLEHLIFKGTPATPNVWAEFTKRGLRANGSTWFDRTNYFASFAANEENLRWYLGWQADAMVNSFIAKRDLASEMTVVRNEMEMGENDPGRILYQRVLALMYDWHNYSNDTIGARADVENVDIARLQAFYRLHYQPDNATLVVAGAFEPAKVLGWIAQSFGKIPKPKRALPKLYTLDAAQDGERTITLRRAGGTPLVYAGYHTPPAAHPDHAAVELLTLVLGDAPSGRLHKRLVEKQLAASVGAEAFGLRDPSVALYIAQLAPEQEPAKASAALLATLESIATEPITAEELERARTKWLKSWELAFTNPETVGVSLSESVAQGDWRLFFLTRDRIKAAKLDDVQRVATERLLASNRTLATYVPTDKPQRAPAPTNVDVAAQFTGFVPRQAADAVAAFDASPANIDAKTQRARLASGMELALLPKPTRGNAVSAVLNLQFGDVKSLANLGEVPALTAAMLDEGTAKLNRQQIRDRLDQLQTEVSFASDAGRLSVGIASKREHIAAAIALVGELLRESTFPEAVLDEQRNRALASLAQQRKEPEAVVANAIERHVGARFPRGDVRHPSSFDETEQDLRAATAAQLRDFHARFYGASNAQFGASGDFDPDAVKQALDAAFGDWRSKLPYERVAVPFDAPEPTRMVLATPDKQNATLGIALPLPLNDLSSDYPLLMLANHLLGGGGNSRLWVRIREKEGLSYGVQSYVAWNSEDERSPWLANAIFAPQNRAKVEAAFKEEIERALQGGFTPAEVAEGQRGLLAARRLGRAQDARLAASLASNERLDRSFAVSQKVDDAIAAATPEQVNAALRKYLKPQRFVTAVGGDFRSP